jgi:hypothetical protein
MRSVRVRVLTRALAAVTLLVLLSLIQQSGLRAAVPTVGLTLPQGWNLVANPGGSVASGPAYTIQKGDSYYETAAPGAPLVAGLGYWVLAQSRSALPLPAGTLHASIVAPAGQFVMIGDPSGILAAQVSGADLLLTYDPSSGYRPDTSGILQPGQGAFALSLGGATITLSAIGTTTASCSTADTGSACPLNGACPAGYPVAVTQDSVAHPAVETGDPAVQGTIALCFNDISQATAAGYTLAPPFRIVLTGPASATTDGITVSVGRAILETPQAFVAREQAAGEVISPNFNPSLVTAVVTVEYQLQNLNQPPTAVAFGVFRADTGGNDEIVPGVAIVASQLPLIVNQGVTSSGSVSGAFYATKFSSIGEVDWLLNAPLAKTGAQALYGLPIKFDLFFAGANAGGITAEGGDGPLQSSVNAAASGSIR